MIPAMLDPLLFHFMILYVINTLLQLHHVIKPWQKYGLIPKMIGLMMKYKEDDGNDGEWVDSREAKRSLFQVGESWFLKQN